MIRDFTTATTTELFSSKADATTTALALAAKADIASPTFTGVPAAPTAASGTNTTQLATTAFVDDATSSGTTPLARTAMLQAFGAAHG